MGEFVECGDSSPQGSDSGEESPHSIFGGLNDNQGFFSWRSFIFDQEAFMPVSPVPHPSDLPKTNGDLLEMRMNPIKQ